jgi:O-antigen/teichoic acid export membrane protein
MLLMLGIGLLAAVASLLAMPWLIRHAFTMSDDLRSEATTAFYILSFTIPIVIYTAGLKGLLEANNLFASTSMLRTLSSIGTYLGPLVAIPFGGNLVIVVVVLLFVRIAIWIAHEKALAKHMKFQRGLSGLNKKWTKPLLVNGGWMSVTNIIGPLMVSLDRFLIGAFISVSAISYYVAPYEIVTRLAIIPMAFSGVLFPLFSAVAAAKNGAVNEHHRHGIAYTCILMFPLLLALSFAAPEILTLWLGPAFAADGPFIMAWLAAGALMGSIAQMPFSLIQGAGKSKWTALLHLAELPPYIALLLFLMKTDGIRGAAIAWFLRSAIDAYILLWLSQRAGTTRQSINNTIKLATTGIFLLVLPTLVYAAPIRLSVFAVLLLAFGVFSWRVLLGSEDRQALKHFFVARFGHDRSERN